MKSTLIMHSEVRGEGSPLVLVPGGLTGWKSWEPFVSVFAKQQRKVIRVQLINVQAGEENRELPGNYSVKTEANALSNTLKSLGITGAADVVGWSYGAFTSLIYALDNPESIRTLTLIEPPAMWVLRETARFDEEAEQTAEFFKGFNGEITEEMLASFLVHAGFVTPGQKARELPQWNGWLPYKQSLRNNPYVVSYNDSIQRVKSFGKPVLLVKGMGSTGWLHKVIDGLADNLPNASVVEFPGGHAPHIVSRELFLKELEQFHRAPTHQAAHWLKTFSV